MSHRLERISSILRHEISELVRRNLKDPRLAELVTIARVLVAADLSLARVYVSVLGSQEEKEKTLTALASAAPYIRRELRARINIKRLPDLTFLPDDAIEQGDHVLSLIDRLHLERKEGQD